MAYKKTSLEDMAEEIADQLVIYLKGGELGRKIDESSVRDDRVKNLNLGSFFNKLDLNITSLKELLRIHFVLKSEVVNFVKKLPWRIRRIKTSTTKIKRIFRNEVRGRIDWQKTIKERCKQNYRDRTIFACDEPDKDYNIKENLVLKKLLSIIYDVVDTELMGKPDNYSWLADWLGEEELANNLRELLYRNIYLKRINIDEVNITDRMIQDTKKSRNVLYREAAELLDFYREEIEGEKWREDSQKIKEMFQTTFINPGKDSVLFELYWAIKLLKCNTETYQLEIIDKTSEAVAHWNSGKTRYSLYHDCTGSKLLSWVVGLDEVKHNSNEYLKRKIESRETYRDLSEEVFNSKTEANIWAGRPDIVIEAVNEETEELEKVVICEVKYTTKKDTAKVGLKELMEYCELIKLKNNFIDDRSSRVEVTGFLLVDSVEVETKGLMQVMKIEKDANNKWQSETWDKREMKI